MFERVGIERRDLRNLAIVVALMALLTAAQVEGTVVVRVVVGLIVGATSGGVFLLVTAIINVFKPEY